MLSHKWFNGCVGREVVANIKHRIGIVLQVNGVELLAKVIKIWFID